MSEPFYTCCEDGMLSQVPPTDRSGLCPACKARAENVRVSLKKVVDDFFDIRLKEPLTEGQLFALLEGCTEHPPQRLPPGWIAFARAVERAHGINPLGVNVGQEAQP